MATLTPQEIASYWLGAGGSQASASIAVAVALAESNGDPNAHSTTQDFGLWQINLGNLQRMGLTPADAVNPGINAQLAVKLSKAGANWGDWCTAWANPSRDCASGALAGPQPGSAAAGVMAHGNYGATLAGAQAAATAPGCLVGIYAAVVIGALWVVSDKQGYRQQRERARERSRCPSDER
jgi:hypothetical protein